MRELGRIVRLQIQRSSLKTGEKPRRSYDPAPLLAVDRVALGPDGVLGEEPGGGAWLVDVHHRAHPETKNEDGVHGVSLGFTSHYGLMRERFGAHHPGMRRREHHRRDHRAHRGRGSGRRRRAARARRPRDRAAGSVAGGAPVPAVHRVGPGRHGRGRRVERAAPVSRRRNARVLLPRSGDGDRVDRRSGGVALTGRGTREGGRVASEPTRPPSHVPRPRRQLISSHASVACFLQRSQVKSFTSVPNP